MNNFYKILTTSALLFSHTILFSQTEKIADSVVSNIIEIGKSDNQTMEHLDILSNRFGGRLLGSDAYENAAEWAAYKFKQWGLDIIMDEAGELPVGFNRGPWFGKMIGGSGEALHFATPSYTSGTKGVQRGHVLKEPKSRAEFNRMRGALKGAWVLITGKNQGWPIDYSEKANERRAALIARNDEIEQKNKEIKDYNRANPKLPAREAIPYVDEPALFYKEMQEAGILGVIQSTSIPIRVLYDRNNLLDLTFETLPTTPDIKLNEHQYAEIEQMVKEREYFQLEFDIRNHFKMGPIKYHNVIGVMRGSEFPDEYILTGGHLDAFDVATGGVDCGSGISPVLESARLISEAGGKPRRTILFCLWAGEEFGLLGSKHWVDSNSDKLHNISNYFNRDGGPTVANSLTVTEAMYNDFEKICAPLNSIDPKFPFTLNKRTSTPRPIPTNAGGSDHAFFMMSGVPTISFGTGDPLGYNFSYGEIWHTERDLYNKSIPEYQNHTSIVSAVVLYGLANLDHILSRENLFKVDSKKKGTKKRGRKN